MERTNPTGFKQLESTGQNKAFIGTLVVMGLLQMASSFAFVLHLTGYLQQDHPALTQSPEKHHDGEQQLLRRHREVTPAAHLPIQPPLGETQTGHTTMIHWNHAQGHLFKIGYHDGRILVREGGLYYIYAKTCFRYYSDVEDSEQERAHSLGTSQALAAGVETRRQNGAGAGPGTEAGFRTGIHPRAQTGTAPEPEAGAGYLFIQYVYREQHSLSAVPLRPALLMKSGSTRHWRKGPYYMCCQQQGGAFPLGPGDALYVSVSYSWMLDPEAEGSYFGAFRVSS